MINTTQQKQTIRAKKIITFVQQKIKQDHFL
jgi:hypothetical protein